MAVLRLGRRRLAVSAPVRVVYVVDEPRRRGFAYGTLPGHPESGEEAFVVELQEDDEVTFTVTAFSRPASTLAARGRSARPHDPEPDHEPLPPLGHDLTESG